MCTPGWESLVQGLFIYLWCVFLLSGITALYSCRLQDASANSDVSWSFQCAVDVIQGEINK